MLRFASLGASPAVDGFEKASSSGDPHDGHFPPKQPRKSCTRGGLLITSNPCPICRDEYLVLDCQNVDLLKHFLHPQSAEILEPKITGLCEKRHKELLLEIEKARDLDMCSPTSSLRIFPKSLRSFWTVSHTTGPLHFIAPQTRVRIVDNIRKGSTGNAMTAQRTTVVEDRNDDMVTDVRSFLRVGTNATAKRKPMVIRVYNYRDRGTTGQTVSHTTGPLHFIAPQTRVRIVDNIRKGSTGNAMTAQRTTVVEDRNDDMVTDVRSFLRVGTNATAKRKPMVIRVYNYRDRGTTDAYSPTASWKTSCDQLAQRLAKLPVAAATANDTDEKACVENHWCQLRDTDPSTALAVLGRARRQHQDWFTGNDAAISNLLAEKNRLHKNLPPTAVPFSPRRHIFFSGGPITSEASSTAPPPTIFDAVIVRLPQVETNVDPDVPSSLHETCRAVQTLPSGKAPGSDAIPAEIDKRGGPQLMDHLTVLFREMWCEGEVPQDFKDATIVHLYKQKGSRQLCDNHRGISLLNIAGKIFARILLNRLKSQCGFRRHRSTTDMVFAVRQLQEKCQERCGPTPTQPLWIRRKPSTR
nr:unnamed protein product [Spirometra erinaceieuropaei]